MMDKPKILFFDIETTPLKAYIWSLGDQIVRHGQLTEDGNTHDIICIAYAWNDGSPVKVLDWGYDKQDSSPMLLEFDSLLSEADIVIGKNNAQFDNKHLNLLRMVRGHPPIEGLDAKTDDLEKQIRKHFGRALPSKSLDYISSLLGLGGKNNINLQDWINIVEKKDRSSFDKMLTYNIKDVEDTRVIWNYMEKYITPKYVAREIKSVKGIECPHCYSKHTQFRGYRLTQKSGKVKRIQCQSCSKWSTVNV